MTRSKIIFSIVLATIFLAAQVIAVGAAPASQETITGTVVEITLDTDTTTNVTTVLVTLDDGTGATQTVRLSLEDATLLGLVVDGAPVDPATMEDPEIEINPDLVIPEEPAVPEEEQHPVGSALSDFFTELLGVDYDTIMDYHHDGFGFGVIAQALWMTNAINNADDTEMTQDELTALFGDILDAKQNHDYSGITLPDGSTPKNWGQFRKAVLKDPEKAKENLGAIMSGHAEEGQSEEIQADTQADTQVGNQQNGHGNNPDKNKGNGNNHNGNGPGKDKNKGKNH